MRLIPADPFPEVGYPLTTVVSPDGAWLAVSCPVNPGRGMERVAVYRKSDLSLWHLVELAHPLEAMHFHPSLPLLAIGTEQGDDMSRQGELILYEPQSRRRISLPFDDVGVTALRWLDERRLELALAVPDVGYDGDGEDAHAQCFVTWDGRLGPDGGGLDVGPRVAVDIDWYESSWQTGVSEPREYLAALAAEAGRSWVRRDEVMAVEALRDGRMVGALRSGTLLECRSADGTLLWSVPEPEQSGHRSGRQLYVTPDEETVWVTVLVGDSGDRKTLLRRFALADGRQLAERRLDFPAVLSARADGAWAARDARELFPPARWPPYETPVYTPSGRQLAALELGECDRSYEFRIRRSPHLLFLRGHGAEPDPEKWVVEATPEGISSLFPLRWDTRLEGRVRGGPGVYVDDSLGPGLVHVCTTTEGVHLLRRAFPQGEVVWAHPVGSEVTGVDAHAGLLHVVTRAQELLALRPEDGKVIRRRSVAVGPYVLTPLSLSASPTGDLLIGTAEGRILVCGEEA